MLNLISQAFKDYWQITIYKFPVIIIALLIFLLFFLIAKIIRSFLNRFTEKFHFQSQARVLIGHFSNLIVIIIGIVLVLSILGVNFTALITGVGLTGLIIGFALQDLIKNFISGILILIQKPFKVGDQILIGHYSGKVQEIKTRYTVLRTFDGNDVIIPNQSVLNETIVCTTSFPKRRSDFILYIKDDNSIKRAVEKSLEALIQTPGILEKPAPQIWITQIEKGYIVLRLFFWWTRWQEKDEILSVKSLALKNVKEKFDREGISLYK